MGGGERGVGKRKERRHNSADGWNTGREIGRNGGLLKSEKRKTEKAGEIEKGQRRACKEKLEGGKIG